METWQVLAFTVLGIILFVAIGAMNSTFKNTTSEVPQVGNQMLFIISCMIAGMLIYLATSHILPEAHARHNSKLTVLATFAGILIMWLVVANLPHE